MIVHNLFIYVSSVSYSFQLWRMKQQTCNDVYLAKASHNQPMPDSFGCKRNFHQFSNSNRNWENPNFRRRNNKNKTVVIVIEATALPHNNNNLPNMAQSTMLLSQQNFTKQRNISRIFNKSTNHRFLVC